MKNVTIAGLLITLFIQVCKRIEESKLHPAIKNSLSIEAVDRLIATFNPPMTILQRMKFKSMLAANGLIQDNDTALKERMALKQKTARLAWFEEI